jgi:serine phosphatase RsbU (regulator of sigma subunit)
VNEHLVENSPAGMFVTLFLGVLDTATGVLRYVNAGHPPALVLCAGAGEARRLDAGGLPVGMLAEQRYEEGCVTLAPGSAGVLYSDGVTEATRADGEMYEEERLVEALGVAGGRSAARVLAALLATVESFVAGAEQADDISIVVVRRSTAGPRLPL